METSCVAVAPGIELAVYEHARGAIRRSAVRWSVGDHDIHAQRPIAVAHLLVDLADGRVFGAEGS